MTRVLVCGGRDFLDWDFCYQQLKAFHKCSDGPITELLHGGARGADSIAARWGKLEGVKVRLFRADWENLGKAAGVIRNQRMLDQKPDVVLAFKGGKGTLDMINRARAAGVRVDLIGWGVGRGGQIAPGPATARVRS